VEQAREPERLTGGKADQQPDSDFDPEALAKGQRVEMEHTDDPVKAREIARDHLVEDQDYYTRLEAIESKNKVKHSATYQFAKTLYSAYFDSMESIRGKTI
jgi:hypothetical protein